MSAPESWTDALAGPLRRAAAAGRWRRIEEARDGGWLLLADEPAADVDWRYIPAAGGDPVPLDPLADERLPELRRSAVESLRRGERIELLAWRVGSRAVLRVESGAGARIVKVYHKDRSLLARWRSLAPSADGRWRTPAVLAWDPERLRLEIELCPGVSLHRRWLAGEGSAADGARVAEILRWLAAAPLPRRFPAHGVEEEVRVLEERLPAFGRTLASPPAAAARLVERVTAALRALPAAPPLYCHRDFHDKQVLLAGERGSLIDLDLAAAGHPALDVGNMLAHVRLRALKGAPLPWVPLARAIAQEARRDRGLEGVLGAWTASPLLRLALIYSRRAHRPGLIAALLASAGAALAEGDEWRGIV
jgi:hypothetical protein